ncbi:S-layer homology domain-containing protein [Bacillus mesophilum]|uniref:S-layer homology domain-containing protein n=1 Tax=Bacillus mesophilum TaxID=1071718 RepID=A0A7V7RME3_9BACI|nr:S-layer homology domain-containing protein [Bacillus mesophilum]KAB2332583.1 S-layer homology domain-containing protein [Bacillus mesophilum]
MKKTASFVLSAAILSSAFAPTYSQAAGMIPFKDIEGSYAQAAILELQENGILQGNGAGKFNPKGTISREQFAIVLANALKLNLEEAPATPTFSDIPASHYAYKHIEAVKKAGIALGYKDGTFNGTEKLNREQMAVLYVRALGKDVDGYDAKLPFSDKGMISAFARDAVGYAAEIGLINGYSNGTFGPNNFATREAVAKVTLPFIKVVENLKPVKPEPTPEPQPEPEQPEIEPLPELPTPPVTDEVKFEDISLFMNAIVQEKYGEYDGWGTTITAKSFTDLGFQGVTEENFVLVLGAAAMFLYMAEDKDPHFEMILANKETVQQQLQMFFGNMTQPDVIENLKANFDYINTSLRTNEWVDPERYDISEADKIRLQEVYKGKDLTPLQIVELSYLSTIEREEETVINEAPIARNVMISGNSQVGQTLIGQYDYVDNENDLEGNSTFKWYRSDDIQGTNKVLIEETSNSYTLTTADEGKYISFEVTPAALAGKATGTSVVSGFFGEIQSVVESTKFAAGAIIFENGINKDGVIMSPSIKDGDLVSISENGRVVAHATVDQTGGRSYTFKDMYNPADQTQVTNLINFINCNFDGFYNYTSVYEITISKVKTSVSEPVTDEETSAVPQPITDLAGIIAGHGPSASVLLAFTPPADATSVEVQYAEVGYNSHTDKWEEYAGWKTASVLSTSNGDAILDKNDHSAHVKLYFGERVRYKLVVAGGSKAGESNVIELIPPMF